MPPLIFDHVEFKVLVAVAPWVEHLPDKPLAAAAQNYIAKAAAANDIAQANTVTIFVSPGEALLNNLPRLWLVWEAIRNERKDAANLVIGIGILRYIHSRA